MKNKPLLALLATLLLPNIAFAGEAPYWDATSNSHFEAIYWTHELGIFEGYADGSFEPNNEINRAELAKVLVLGSGVVEDEVDACAEGATRTFSDVPASEWYTDYVYCAEAKGWVSGDDGKSTFRPGDPILKAEAFKMLVQSQYGTPDASYEGDAWYDIYVNFLTDHNIIMEEEFYGGTYLSYSYLALGSYEDNIGFEGTMSSKMARFDMAELLYRLHVVFEVNDGEPFNLLFTFEEISSLFGTEFEIEDGTLFIADPYFGFRADGIPLDKVGDAEDLRIYIENPSAFENGGETIWYVVYPFEEDSNTFYGSGHSAGYASFFGITIADPDNHYFYSDYDTFENDTGLYGVDCDVYVASSVAEFLEQICVVDEDHNLDGETINLRAY